MRDKLKEKSYFETFIKERYESLEKRVNKLKQEAIKVERIASVKQAMSSSILHIMIAKFSNGDFIKNIKNDFESGCNLMKESLANNKGKVHIKEGKYLNQYYFHTYQELLQYLCLAYLLDVSDKDFQVLVDVIDRDNISDNLFEFIIRSRISNRIYKFEEEYDKNESMIFKVYYKLRQAINQTDNTKASKLVKQFLEKDFYNKNMNLYNSHKSKANIYCGYWSFEAATIVKIMGLDDSSFIDQQYYPKDLIH